MLLAAIYMLLRGLGASMIDNSGHCSFHPIVFAVRIHSMSKGLLGVRWLETTELSLVAIVISLAGCFSVPLSIFSIDRGILHNDEQCLLSRVLICHGEPELYGNSCLPKERLSLKCNEKLK